MPGSTALAALQVVEVQYAGARPVSPDHWAFEAYGRSGAYSRAGVPVDSVRPLVPAADLQSGEAQALGTINGAIADAVATGLGRGTGLLMSGGNCHHATGVLGGLQDACGPGARIGLVWFDAHGDFNTPQTTLSGSLGGMPLAVCAGLAHPEWREGSHIVAAMPTDRILLWDGRNLDPPEEVLLRSVGVGIAAPASGLPGADLRTAIQRLAREVDIIYLHLDADILDETLVPNHATAEPDGPTMRQVLAAVDTVMATSKVVAYAVVSVYTNGCGAAKTVESGTTLIAEGLAAWRKHGIPDLATSSVTRREKLP